MSFHDVLFRKFYGLLVQSVDRSGRFSGMQSR